MTLATATADGRPSARVVLLRGLDERGLVFFTNRTSRKGDELADNPRAALVLHWPELGRQVRVEGAVERVSRRGIARVLGDEAARKPNRRVGVAAVAAACAIDPSSMRSTLPPRSVSARETIPLPEFWGGYRVVPELVELWEHRENRLHDRIRYRRTPSGWERERLAP